MKILLVHTPFDWKRPLTIVAYLIRKVTGNYYNHCAFLDEPLGKQEILESDINGVVRTPLVDWIKNQTVTVVEIPSELRVSSRMKAHSMVGRFGYSFVDLFWFMPIYIITGKFYGRKADTAKNKPTCYEYCAYCLDMSNWFRMTPDEFQSNLGKGYKILNTNITAKQLLR